MLTWWLLSFVKVRFTASGTYQEPNPDPPYDPPYFTIPWSLDKELFFDIAYKPNKGPTGSDGSERLIDCELYNEFEIRRTTENEPGPNFRLYNAYTHYFPFHGISGEQPDANKDFPRYGLLELFCYIDPLVAGAFVTNSGLLIISTRNKDYKDVIFEGKAPESNNRTEQIGFKSTTFTLFNKQTTFYFSLWWIGTNLGSANIPAQVSVSNFNVEFIEKGIWQPA